MTMTQSLYRSTCFPLTEHIEENIFYSASGRTGRSNKPSRHQMTSTEQEVTSAACLSPASVRRRLRRARRHPVHAAPVLPQQRAALRRDGHRAAAGRHRQQHVRRARPHRGLPHQEGHLGRRVPAPAPHLQGEAWRGPVRGGERGNVASMWVFLGLGVTCFACPGAPV